MIYKELANYYDALVKDDQATQQWVAFTKKFSSGDKLLELACGSGEITIALANEGYDVLGTDVSIEMIDKARSKDDSNKVSWKQMDMLKFDVKEQYDTVVCYCDSMNYLIDDSDLDKVFNSVYSVLKVGGTFLFDIHSIGRKIEFEEEFIEEGMIDEVGYQWSIRHEDSALYHNFSFYDTNGNVVQEQHYQKVHNPKSVSDKLSALGYSVRVYTDFEYEGIQEGEKIFFVARKEN